MAQRILIAGGGFGGFYAARSLERLLAPASGRVTLINDANCMLYTPLLPGAAGATLDPRHVVVPLRSMLKGTDLVIGRVSGCDPAGRTLSVTRIDGEPLQLRYDQLILALGSISRTLPIPGLAEHAIGLKSLSDATALRNRLLSCLDIAESLEDPALRSEYLSFVFVGAGYAGVEGLAEVQDLAAQVIRLYPRCAAHGMRWLLVEARDRIMPEVPASLSAFAERELRRRGIEVLNARTLSEITPSSVTLSDGEVIPARTVVWTAGVRPAPVIARLGFELDTEGRVRTDHGMRVPKHPEVWAIGDCAAVPDPGRPGAACPPTAQHAIRQGRLVAANVAATLAGGQAKRFRYRTRGVVCELGQRQAVAITLGVRWRGLPAWVIARTYHLLLMPGWGRRLRLLVDWNVALLFGRDSSSPGRLGEPTPLEHSDRSQDMSLAQGVNEL
ncbi:MAG: NAD(P)/FAD-dependent oxidoreductase [Solirubrobacteraceae bacterium]